MEYWGVGRGIQVLSSAGSSCDTLGSGALLSCYTIHTCVMLTLQLCQGGGLTCANVLSMGSFFPQAQSWIVYDDTGR